jgi:hypothetical protein
MDWQYLLVHDGQTIVISTGLAVGITAVVFYRVKSRWGKFEAEKAEKRWNRAEQKRLLAEGWTWGEEENDRT